MIYNLANVLDAQNAEARLRYLRRKGCVVELSEKKPKRTTRQNSYLHLIIGYFATQTGDDPEWVKQQYFKKLCNPDIFIGERDDKFLGSVKYLKSSSELTTEQMSMSIDRFRSWAAAEAGIYIPDPTSKDELLLMQIEVEKNRRFLYGNMTY